MTIEDALNETYKNPNAKKYRNYIPSMITRDRVERAMKLYADTKVKDAMANVSLLRTLDDEALETVLTTVVLKGGVKGLIRLLKDNQQ